MIARILSLPKYYLPAGWLAFLGNPTLTHLCCVISVVQQVSDEQHLRPCGVMSCVSAGWLDMGFWCQSTAKRHRPTCGCC